MSYLPNDLTLSATLDNTQVQGNDAALDTAISGNLTELNFSSATRVPNSMLASPNVEEIITLRWGAKDGVGTAIPGASATQPLDCIPIPASSITYTVLKASYTYFTPSAAAAPGSISVNFGTVSGGNFTSSTTLVSSVALTANTGANQTITGNLTLAATSFTAATTPSQIALLSTLASAAPTISLVVTLVVTRSLQ
jgi:hypothetical protein